jgi:hypothetical protein
MTYEKSEQICPTTAMQLPRKYSSYSFLTSALDGVSGQRHAPAALYSGNGPLVPIVQEAWWASELLWTQWIEKKSFASAGVRTPTSIGHNKRYTSSAV